MIENMDMARLTVAGVLAAQPKIRATVISVMMNESPQSHAFWLFQAAMREALQGESCEHRRGAIRWDTGAWVCYGCGDHIFDEPRSSWAATIPGEPNDYDGPEDDIDGDYLDSLERHQMYASESSYGLGY